MRGVVPQENGTAFAAQNAGRHFDHALRQRFDFRSGGKVKADFHQHPLPVAVFLKRQPDSNGVGDSGQQNDMAGIESVVTLAFHVQNAPNPFVRIKKRHGDFAANVVKRRKVMRVAGHVRRKIRLARDGGIARDSALADVVRLQANPSVLLRPSRARRFNHDKGACFRLNPRHKRPQSADGMKGAFQRFTQKRRTAALRHGKREQAVGGSLKIAFRRSIRAYASPIRGAA